MNIDEELGFVIHDEIHYINDRDRGHIWKAIMNQPKHIPYIGLSATIASPEKLCQWSRVQRKPIEGKFTYVLIKLEIYLSNTVRILLFPIQIIKT